jgi:pimeloyl-ACP methyl ester carboxylesterase
VDVHHQDVDGVPTRWLEHDEGPAVVLVHGIPTSAELWRHVMPLVHGRSLAFEMTGYGGSIPAGRGRGISVAAQARHLLRWLDTIGVQRAVFVGHDLGGGVVQIAAVQEPARCAGLVLTNSIAYDSWPIPSVKAMRAAAPVVARLPHPLTRLVLRTFFHRGHDDRARAEEALGVHWPYYAAHGGGVALAHQVRSLDVQDTIRVQDRLRALDVPARVVWGAADQFQRIGYGERLARDLGTDLRPIDGGRHWTPEDHPDQVAAAVNEVVAEVGRNP